MSDLNDILIEAMKSELEAKNFYINASNKAQSQAGKNLFKDLSEFEQNHYEKVKNIIESLENEINIDISAEEQNIKHIESEVEGEFEPNKDEIVTVINLAIESEKNAQERYEKISTMLEDEENKKIINSLAQDERNHKRILEDQFYQLSNRGIIIWE
jgi:rubrerythrin